MRKIPAEVDEPVIAVISDLHGEQEACRAIVDKLKETSLQAVVLAGDIAKPGKGSLRWVLKRLLKLDVPLIAFGGSHENGAIYDTVMQEFKDSPLLINAMKTRNQRIKIAGFELLIIPGCEVVSSGSKPYNGGSMWLTEEKKTKKNKQEMDKRIQDLRFSRKAHPVYMQDIKRLFERSTSKPSRIIAIAHNPIRCRTRRGIDAARFGKPKSPFMIQKKHLRLKAFKKLGLRNEAMYSMRSVVPLEYGQLLKRYKYPMAIKRANVGSVAINKLLRKHRVTKFVCGHIHEAGPRAIDKQEQIVKQQTPSSKLYINSGQGELGIATLLTLHKNGKVSHQFLRSMS